MSSQRLELFRELPYEQVLTPAGFTQAMDDAQFHGSKAEPGEKVRV
jgi:hypothetical protein